MHELLKPLVGKTLDFEDQQENGFAHYYVYHKRPVKIVISKPDDVDWHYEIEAHRGKSFWRTLGTNKTLEGVIAEIKKEYNITCNVKKKKGTQTKLAF